MKISELNEDQKGHLAWRLEHNTYCGYGTACRIARGEFGDMDLEEAFMKADKSRRSAKILAKKVMEFTVDPDVKFALNEGFTIARRIIADVHLMPESPKRQIMLFRQIAEQLNTMAKYAEQMIDACEKQTPVVP